MRINCICKRVSFAIDVFLHPFPVSGRLLLGWGSDRRPDRRPVGRVKSAAGAADIFSGQHVASTLSTRNLRRTAMRRSLAALFACSLVVSCGGDDGGPTPGSINPPGPAPAPSNFSLRFFGTGAGDIDRVKIPLLNPNGISRLVNIGATDFTLEFWIKGANADNPTVQCTTG